MPDNWQHRSENMRCKTCMWFVPKIVGDGYFRRTVLAMELAMEGEVGPLSLGRCRRHAPTLGGWPAIFATDWCGDHKLDENKIVAERSRVHFELPEELMKQTKDLGPAEVLGSRKDRDRE